MATQDQRRHLRYLVHCCLIGEEAEAERVMSLDLGVHKSDPGYSTTLEAVSLAAYALLSANGFDVAKTLDALDTWAFHDVQARP